MANLVHYDHTMKVWMEKAEATKQRLHYVGSVSQDGKL